MSCGGQRRFHDTRYKDHDFVDLPQPTPDAGGEWRVEAMPTHGWRVVDATGQELVADVYRKEDAQQIVANHNAVGLLVAALEAARGKICELTWEGAKPQRREAEALVVQIDAALAAAGRQP
jgi:hypothetical protein